MHIMCILYTCKINIKIVYYNFRTNLKVELAIVNIRVYFGHIYELFIIIILTMKILK